jgi:hypothetical protein
MRELSLHIMDIVQNSITAGAKHISILVEEDIQNDIFKIRVIDDGCGIPDDIIFRIRDPFFTSRVSRRVGLGVSLLEAASERCGGYLNIKSKVDQGTEVEVVLRHSHIDRMPLGRIEDTIITCLLNPGINIVYIHIVDTKEFIFDSREVKKIVGEQICEPEILEWIRGNLSEGIKMLGGGA